MKILLILWAIGLIKCEKLDRTYLPPRGAVAAGGYSSDLNPPLEFSRKNYLSTLEPGNTAATTASGSLSSKYPNIVLGIDRKGPSVATSSEFSANRPESSASKVYDSPSSSYDLNQSSIVSPVRITDTTLGPISTISQEYSSTNSDPKLSYDQYLIQQTINPTSGPRNSVSNFANKNVGQLSLDNPNLRPGNVRKLQQDTPFGSNLNKYVFEQVNKIGAPQSKLTNIEPVSTANTPNSFERFTTQQSPREFVGIKANSEDFYDRKSSGYSSTLAPGQFFTETSTINTDMPLPNDNFAARYNSNFPTQRTQTEGDRNAVILNYENKITPEGFAYSFDTSNGIHADESGTAINGVKAIGSYSYLGDDGKLYNVEYTADENGFLPRGDHLPTAPPIPEAILKGIELAERNKKLGIIDDGSYDDAKYGHGRYQGLMDRVYQNQYNDFIANQPNIEVNKQQTKTAPFKNIGSTLENGEGFGQTNYEIGMTIKYPSKSKMDNVYETGFLKVENDKALPQIYDANQPNGNSFINANSKNINNLRNKPDGTMTTSRVDKKLTPNAVTNAETLGPGPTNSQKGYNDIYKSYDSGYDYTQPQNPLNDNDKDSFQSQFSNTKRYDEINPDAETYNGKSTAQSSTTPIVSFYYNNQTPDSKSQTSGNKFKDPNNSYDNINSVQGSNNGITQPDFATFYNTEAGQRSNNKNMFPERAFSTQEPNYASTTLRPINYQSPLSTLRSQYSISTTPVPSSFNPSTNIFSYSQTTPSASQFTSTLRPSVTSVQPTSGITSGPPGYTRRISGLGQVEDSGVSTIKPNSFGKKIIGKPTYQGTSDKIPATQIGISRGLQPQFEESGPRSQKLGVTLRPMQFRGQSSTEKVIGEEFNGPKQAERFDPQAGYYY